MRMTCGWIVLTFKHFRGCVLLNWEGRHQSCKNTVVGIRSGPAVTSKVLAVLEKGSFCGCRVSRLDSFKNFGECVLLNRKVRHD